MKPTDNTPPYSYLVRWSPDDREFVASFLELPELSGLASTIRGAIKEAQVALRAWMEAAKRGSFEIPEPSMDKPCMILDAGFVESGITAYYDIPEDFVSDRDEEKKTISSSVPLKLNEVSEVQT